MASRIAAVLALAAVLAGWTAVDASAHANLIAANPEPGTTLGATPTAVQVTLSERPVAALSSIRIIGGNGVAYQTGPAEAVTGDPLSLEIPVRPLGRGIYTVQWRVDSAVDGHATAGAYQFGVLVSPSQLAATPHSTTKPVSSPLELVSRWILLIGLVALLGGASAAIARFAGPAGVDLRLAGAGWALAVIGLLALAEAQRSNASSSLGALLRSPVGHALIWRAVAIGTAGAMLLIAWRAPRIRRVAVVGAGLAAVAAVAVHVANGHAAASRWPSSLSVTLQVVHFAVAGVWIGGLAALLIGLRGAASDEKSASVRRFAVVAALGLVLIVATGVARAVSELRSWNDLIDTGYGRAVLAKLALVTLIAVIADRNRRRGVPVTATDLGPLRRMSRTELALAVIALGVAGLLGTLAPPVSGKTSGLTGLSASGSDASGTIRASLTTVSNEPGPNRFDARIESGSGLPIAGASVSLLFSPLDDPGVGSSTLALSPASPGTYIGSGANMKFDGRWGVRVLVAHAGKTVEVPLELEPLGPPQSLTIEHIAGRAPTYTKLVGIAGFIRISPHPGHAGHSELVVTFYTAETEDFQPVRRVVITSKAGHSVVQPLTVRPAGTGRVIAPIDLAAGHNEIAVVAHTPYGARMRSVFDLDVPAR